MQLPHKVMEMSLDFSLFVTFRFRFSHGGAATRYGPYVGGKKGDLNELQMQERSLYTFSVVI